MFYSESQCLSELLSNSALLPIIFVLPSRGPVVLPSSSRIKVPRAFNLVSLVEDIYRAAGRNSLAAFPD